MLQQPKYPFCVVLQAIVSGIILAGSPVEFSWADGSGSITATLRPGRDVGVGFDLLPDAMATATITLKRPVDPAGWYIVTDTDCKTSSTVVDKSGTTIWERQEGANEEQHVWKGYGFDKNTSHNIVQSETFASFAGLLFRKEGRPGGGGGSPTVFQASVADIDIDVDSLGLHSDEPTSHHWPPDGSYEEDETEAGDETGGLYLPASLWTGQFPSSLPSDTDYKALMLTLNPKWVGAPSPDGNVGTLTFDPTGSGFALYEMTGSDSGTLVTSGIRVPPSGFSGKQYAILTNENFTASGGIKATFTWDSNLSSPNVDITAVDCVRLSPWFVELVLDSDNNNGLDNPDRGRDEKAAKMQAPGKIIVVNHGDLDQDGVPDYANLDLSGATDQPPLVPVILRVKFAGDASDATVKFDYGGEALPSSSEFTGVDLGDGFRNYTAAKKGVMRLWKARNTRTTADFIVSGQEYTASDLGFSDSSGDDIQEVTYYAEGINEGAQEITVTVKFTLGSSNQITSTDKAKTTVTEPAILYNCSNGSADGSTHDLPLGVPDVNYDINAADEIIKHQVSTPSFWWRDPDEEGDDITENTLVDAEPLLITIPQVLIDQGFQFRLKAQGLGNDSEIRIYRGVGPGGDGGNRLLYVTTTQYAEEQVSKTPVATLVGTTPSATIQLDPGTNEFVAMFKKQAGADVQAPQIALQMVKNSGVPLPPWWTGDTVKSLVTDARSFWTEFNCREDQTNPPLAMRRIQTYPMDDIGGVVRTEPDMDCYPAPVVNPQGAAFPDARPHSYYFMFVHGYNSNEASARKYNGILFKNMFLGLGFRGHYVGFLWHGDAWHDPANSFALFRPNVGRALQSGQSLADALTSLNQQVTTSENVDVMAHSLGNLVVWEGARLLERVAQKPWPNGRYAKSYVMVEGAVQREVFRPEGPYTNSDQTVYTANELRTHSWAFWCNQTNHNTSGVFNQVYNSYNAGDTALTTAMRTADWDKSLWPLPVRPAMHFTRILDLGILLPPYPLRSMTGTTNSPNPNPPPAFLPDSPLYALHQIPALMQNRALLYGPGDLTLPIGAVAPPQNETSGNWTMNNAAQQGWTGHSAAWDQPFNRINQWYTWLVGQQNAPQIQRNKW